MGRETAAGDRRPGKRGLLKVELVDRLRREIVDGLVPSGSWLAQEEVARRFGVSQTPVREAFKVLEGEGLVEYVPYRGVHVAGFTLQDVHHLFGVREVLEAAAVQEAAPRLTEAAFGELEEILRAMQTLRDPAHATRRRELNAEFHQKIWSACDSRYLKRLITLVWRLIPDSLLYEGIYARQRHLWGEWITRDDDAHSRILGAIGAADVDEAVSVTREHVRNSAEELGAVLGIRPVLQTTSDQEVQSGEAVAEA